MKSALTPLSSDEEIALRRVAHGSSVGPPVAARLRDLALIQRTNGGYRLTPLGHVWTAPWQEPSDLIAALVGCGHVSGLLMRQERPLALMLCADRVPIVSTHFKVR